jgi:DNA-binding MarR family transcriptional regulator
MLTALARSLNRAAMDALAVSLTSDAAELTKRSAFFASRVIDRPSSPGYKHAARVERVVANAIHRQWEVLPARQNQRQTREDVQSLIAAAKTRSDLGKLRNVFAGYVGRLASAGSAAAPALEILGPVLEQFETALWSAEMSWRGFPQGFTEVELAVLRSLNSDYWSEGDRVRMSIRDIAGTTELRSAIVAAALESLAKGGLVGRDSNPGKRFWLHQEGHAALTRAEVAKPSQTLVLA